MYYALKANRQYPKYYPYLKKKDRGIKVNHNGLLNQRLIHKRHKNIMKNTSLLNTISLDPDFKNEHTLIQNNHFPFYLNQAQRSVYEMKISDGTWEQNDQPCAGKYLAVAQKNSQDEIKIYGILVEEVTPLSDEQREILKQANNTEDKASVMTLFQSIQTPFNHSHLVAGEAVFFAGHIEIDDDGLLLEIDNNSGHYKPSFEAIKPFIAWLADELDFEYLEANVWDELGEKVYTINNLVSGNLEYTQKSSLASQDYAYSDSDDTYSDSEEEQVSSPEADKKPLIGYIGNEKTESRFAQKDSLICSVFRTDISQNPNSLFTSERLTRKEQADKPIQSNTLNS